MKLISYLGQTFYLLITFSILIVHNEYWNLPLFLIILLNLQNIATNYIYPILPILALSILIFTLAKYGKQNYSIWKYLLNISAWFLLVGSICLMAYLDGDTVANKNLFEGIIPFITLILFSISSFCFLINNVVGLIKFYLK